MSYPLAADVDEVLGSVGLPAADSTLTAWCLASAIAEVERELDTTYTAAAGTRRYDGDRTASLVIAPCTAITAVELVDLAGTVVTTYTAGADYLAYPADRDVKTRLVRTTGQGFFGESTYGPGWWGTGNYWPKGRQNIRVSATFGEAIPDDVAMAIRIRAALYLLDPDSFKVTGIRYGYTITNPDGSINEEIGQDTLRAVRLQWEEKVRSILARRSGDAIYF